MSGIYIKVVPLPESNPNQKPTSFFVVSLFAGITVSAVDEFELDGSRGISNFVMKWPGEREQSHIKIVPIKKVDGCYRADKSGNFVQILAMECRGLTPIKWHPMCDFSATSAGGFTFDEVDLSDDWAEYDENNDMSVSIMGLESKIERG